MLSEIFNFPPSGQGRIPANILYPHLQLRPEEHPGKDDDHDMSPITKFIT